MKTKVTKTSIKTYYDLISGKAANSQYKLILDQIVRLDSDFTRTELIDIFQDRALRSRKMRNQREEKKYAPLTEKSTMAARCNELLSMGIVFKSGKRKCKITGREVERLVLRTTENDQQLGLF